MSSFFTAPRAQKRKRPDSAPESAKKRPATLSNFSSRGGGLRGRGSRTNTRGGNSGGRGGRNAPQARSERDEAPDSSISGSDSDSNDGSEDLDAAAGEGSSSSDSDAEGETAAERRIRLAERYLEGTRKEVEDEYGFDAEDLDRDILAERLQEDVAESKGKVYRKLAEELDFNQATHTTFRWNSQTVTSVATCPPYAYTTSGKDMSIIKWRLQDLPKHQWPQTTRKKPKKPDAPPKKQPERMVTRRGNSHKLKDKNFQGHTGAILVVAASQDGKFVVTGGADKRIVVHDAETLKPLRAFTHHRDAVTGLVFRRGTNQLYSSSKDRTVKVWSLDELAYVETLFGHQHDVVDIDALAQERCVSVGARDRTARLWKVAEETQLLFRGGGGASSDRRNTPLDPSTGEPLDPKSLAHEGSMDRVAMLDDELFVTGSDNGAIALWSTTKKKPLFVLARAHGLDPPLKIEEASAEKHPDTSVIPPPQPRWITALKAVPYSDLVLSGSWDGWVRVWRLSEDKKKLEAVGVLGKAAEDLTTVTRPVSSQSRSTVLNGTSHTNGVNGHTDGDGDTTLSNGINGTNGHNDTHLPSPSQAQSHGTPQSPPAESQPQPQPLLPHPTSHLQPQQSTGNIKGIINDISLFERGDRGKDGLCVVLAVGKEHRLGRWKVCKDGRNGGVVIEVPRRVVDLSLAA